MPHITRRTALLSAMTWVAATPRVGTARTLSELGEYTTRTAQAVAEMSIPSGYTALRTLGFYDAYDGGGGTYSEVSREPSHGGKLRSADGRWWELKEHRPINPRQLGARGDGVTNDGSCLQAALCGNWASVEIDEGVYCTDRGLVVGDGVSLFGRGERSEIRAIKALVEPLMSFQTAKPGLRGTRYQLSGHIKLSGGNMASTGLYVGLAVFCKFEEFYISGFKNGFIVDASQNNTFSDFDIDENEIGAIIINGAGNNLFSRIEISNCGQPPSGQASHLRIENDPVWPGSKFQPFRSATENTFDRCIFEGSQVSPAPPRVRISAGNLNHFRDCDFGGSNTLCLIIDQGCNVNRVTNCYFGGSGQPGTYAVKNSGYDTSIDGGSIESFGDLAVIKTSSLLRYGGIHWGKPEYYVQGQDAVQRDSK